MINTFPWRIFARIKNYPIYGILLSGITKNLAIADNSTGGWTVWLKVYSTFIPKLHGSHLWTTCIGIPVLCISQNSYLSWQFWNEPKYELWLERWNFTDVYQELHHKKPYFQRHHHVIILWRTWPTSAICIKRKCNTQIINVSMQWIWSA